MPGLQTITLLQRRFCHPRFWSTWAGFALVFLVVHLPHSWRIRAGSMLGALGYLIAINRKHIVNVNLSLCFPDMTTKERQTLNRKVFRSAGISIIETATVWLRDPKEFRHLVQINGLDNLHSALAQGKGVILLGMHLSTLDFCGAVLASYCQFDVMYRRNKNSLIEAIMTRGRHRSYPHAIERDDIRSVIKSLKEGRAIWYGPDQDYGRDHSVFAPLFGQPAATITATSRIAEINDSPVIIFTHYRSEDDSHYELSLSEPLENYPTSDPLADATRINQIVESAIAKRPEQYWWLHRRFKTPPEGEKRPY